VENKILVSVHNSIKPILIELSIKHSESVTCSEKAIDGNKTFFVLTIKDNFGFFQFSSELGYRVRIKEDETKKNIIYNTCQS
jgi:hypothetical protein